MNDDVLSNQVLELRRGSIVLAILGLLMARSHYGYALLKSLEGAGVDVDGSTLYPLLRRLEKQGVLLSEWDTADSRPRKYYRVTPDGERLYHSLRQEWQSIQENINRIII